MNLERRLSLAGMAALVGLCAFAPGQAQKRPSEAATAIITSGEDSHPEATATAVTVKGVQPQRLLLPRAGKLSLLDQAYLDVFSILKDDNSCSRFYGGPAAIEVLNRLRQQLAPGHLDISIALRMTGPTMIAQNYSTLISYRLFEKAELNLDGSFYKGKVAGTEPVPAVGQFQPNTREARVTILLHELGHLIRTPDKQWILRDDGDSDAHSRENTRRVIAVCTNQITQLEHLSFAQELLNTSGDDLRPRAATKPSVQ